MGNKLKKIFSMEMPEQKIHLTFANAEDSQSFRDAISKVEKEGKGAFPSGKAKIRSYIQVGDGSYTIEKENEIQDMVVAPQVEPIEFEVETEYGKKKIVFYRYQTMTQTILETMRDSIVYMKIIFDKNQKTINDKFTFQYHVQPEEATDVKDLLESYSSALAFMARLNIVPKEFAIPQMEKVSLKERLKDQNEKVKGIVSFFYRAIRRYQMLLFIEGITEKKFNPKEIDSDKETWRDVEEICLLLKYKTILRINGKVNESELNEIKMKSLSNEFTVGSKLDITFQSEGRYSLWGQEIVLYTANLLSGAVVRKIEEMEPGDVKVIYGCEESSPIRIAYKAFLTEEEARDEVTRIMDQKEKYLQAHTLEEYLENR